MTQTIVEAARGYLGTRFHHQGRLKKSANHRGGIDCLGLLSGVAGELGLRGRNGELLSSFDATDYSHQPDVAELGLRLDALLEPVPLSAMRAGDVALFEVDGRAQHMGIISGFAGGFGVIHAYAPARAVVEHALDAYWRRKIVRLFRVTSFWP